ncbi:MAG: CDP-alcohol phosphatidyltransferase [Anaerolineales bacterium]|nr:CDP-alcohol phosphatidyltransferase [Anaerolineales bacterium]
MPEVEKQKRVHDMLLGPLERPALQWFSARMPGWVTPDILTGFGVFGAVLIFAGYALTNIDPGFLWLASLGFVINWFGDSLDGTLARYRKIERPKYGFFIDHTVDSFNMALIFIGLGLSAYVRLDIACLAGIGYLLMSILAYVAAIVSGKFQISYAKVGPTEMRLIAIIANTIIFFVGNPILDLSFVSVTVFDLVVLLVAVVEMMFYVVSVGNQLRYWNKIDPGKKREEELPA